MRIYRHAAREGTRGLRSWVHAYTDDEQTIAEGSLEGYIGSGAQHTGVSISLGSSGPASVKLFAGLAHVADVWIGAKSYPATNWLTERIPALKKAADVNVIDVRVHDGAIWWGVWHPRHSWKSGTPRWRSGNFNVVDALLGRRVHSKRVLDGPTRVEVPMPEGCYPATVTIEEASWKRPRWPWPLIIKRYDLDVLKEDGSKGGYIPVPGKGESSWDCGPDGVFSQSGVGATVEKAIGEVVAGALRDRQRHAGSHRYAERIGP